MPRITMIGTELAPLREASGALERVVLAWAAALRSAEEGYEVTCLDADAVLGLPVDRLAQSGPDLVVLNNRPLWAEEIELPVLHLLHNYPDAWGDESADMARVRAALEGGAVSAVSDALAWHAGEAYELTEPVSKVSVEVEPVFFGQSWRGEGGPVLFPNRLLEKKGVRHFLELAPALAARGHHCVMFRHLAPWTEPTAEQRGLLRLAEASRAVELISPPSSRFEMAAWYAGAGVVACPSIGPEGLGLVALEAQAVGAPLVTSGLGGLAEATYPPNETVGSFDGDEWCAAIERAARRPRSLSPRRQTEALHGKEVAASSISGAVRRALRGAGEDPARTRGPEGR